jgi:hypothetical protein
MPERRGRQLTMPACGQLSRDPQRMHDRHVIVERVILRVVRERCLKMMHGNFIAAWLG